MIACISGPDGDIIDYYDFMYYVFYVLCRKRRIKDVQSIIIKTEHNSGIIRALRCLILLVIGVFQKLVHANNNETRKSQNH